MKNAFLKLSGLSLVLSGTCLAEIQVGNGAIQLDTSLTGVYDSNLRDSVNNISDYYLSFQPTLRYRSTGSRFTTEASVGVRNKRYLDNPAFNSDDADGRFDWGMQRVDGHTTAATLNLRYFENTDAAIDINELVRTKVFVASTSGEVLVADRNLFSAGLSYQDSKRDIGSDQTSDSEKVGYSYIGFTDGTALNLNLIHQDYKSTDNVTGATTLDQKSDTATVSLSRPIYEELKGSVTYGYRWLDRGVNEARLGLGNQQGPLYAINLDGQFLPKQYFPKTTGTFRISYEEADAPGLNDQSRKRLVGQLNINWAAREHTKVGFTASRSQGLSIVDDTVVYDTVGVNLDQAIGSFINTHYSLSYTNADYVNRGRTDDRYEARADATYKISRLWSTAVSYSYLRSHSDFYFANFTRHIVSSTLTYAF